MSASIHNVVFDIGWVLVRINYRPLLEFLDRHHGVPAAEREAVMNAVGLEEHECGRMSGEGLLQRIAALAGRQATAAQARAIWLDMFELDAAMVELAHRISAAQRVYLLSNIGDLHWMHLAREHRLHAIGHGALPSYLAGVMKPHADIYSAAERRFALVPEATVFIDDRADNIAAARARGWHGIVHESHAATLGQLRGLKVTC
jgi:HAD superfamily hydrolase (TIGR01509 family)